jgi:hypothetical protein
MITQLHYRAANLDFSVKRLQKRYHNAIVEAAEQNMPTYKKHKRKRKEPITVDLRSNRCCK